MLQRLTRLYITDSRLVKENKYRPVCAGNKSYDDQAIFCIKCRDWLPPDTQNHANKSTDMWRWTFSIRLGHLSHDLLHLESGRQMRRRPLPDHAHQRDRLARKMMASATRKITQDDVRQHQSFYDNCTEEWSIQVAWWPFKRSKLLQSQGTKLFICGLYKASMSHWNKNWVKPPILFFFYSDCHANKFPVLV